MYCSITFKGRKGPQDPKMVKLEMIFYKTGYTRIPRVVSITGAYKCWNNETQSFESASSEYLKKNQLLLELKEKYMSVVERWEKEGRNFSVLQWADCLKPKEEEKAKQESKVLTVLQLINARIEYFENHEKFKNGKLVKSVGTASMYKQLRTTLGFHPEAVQQRPVPLLLHRHYPEIPSGIHRLSGAARYRKRKPCRLAPAPSHLPCISKLRQRRTPHVRSQPHNLRGGYGKDGVGTIRVQSRQSEHHPPDGVHGPQPLLRAGTALSHLFLFSFYSGGMANVDVVNLTWDMINEKEGMIVYERTKFPKLAKPLLIDRLIVILEKYRGKGVGDYVFPVYTEKHVTDKQKMGRRSSFSTLVSETLDKVCEILGIDEKMTWYTARGTFISSELDAGTPITHVAEMAGNSARTIEKHYYKNTKQEELRQRMNARYGSWGQQSI